MIKPGLRLGALGGSHTFNGQAAEAMRTRYPEFSTIVHYPTSDEAIAAALRGDVDATCAPEQSSMEGFHAGMLARMAVPGSAFHVIAELARAYRCSLLGKSGTALAQVKKVLGHTGSIAHSRSWLQRNLPNAEIEIVTSHSLAAARLVLRGDGSIASVGSLELVAKFGLVELARDIDGGSMVNYWAVSPQPYFSDTPDRLVVTGCFGDDDAMSKLVAGLLQAGYALRTVYSRATGRTLDEYDCVLRFKGSGRLDVVRATVAKFGSVRLAGAFEARV